jgi:tetratricopeptide (TPR) repeat protein
MNEPALKPPAGPLDRLDRLEAYLRDDPQNLVLLADAFETALRAGAIERAEFHLRHGQALKQEAEAWAAREAHWLLAQHRFPEARAVLTRLQAAAGQPLERQALVAHDLAYIDLREGRHAEGAASLQPWLERVDLSGAPRAAIQALWLRLMHRSGQLDEALQWARPRIEQGALSPEALGVASLMALDGEDVIASHQWAEAALRQHGVCAEALVARASTALAQRDGRTARELLGHALARNPGDGRTLSALGFCELLERRWDAARATFEQALAAMPEHIGTWHGLGWTALSAGDTAGARRAFEEALARDRNFAESHGALAVVQALAGETEAAEGSIERALRLNPESLAPRYAQAVLSGEANDLAALRRRARRALGSRPAPLGGRLVDVLGLSEDAEAP